MRHFFRTCCVFTAGLLGALLSACGYPTAAPPRPAAEEGGPLTRLLFQDHAARALRWADVRLDGDGRPALGSVGEVDGWPKLAAGQRLVQMQEHNGVVLVGVRDGDDGRSGSGWVLLHTGVGYLDHGDHGHWQFRRDPQVWDSRIDREQGNPAHLYLYGGRFFLANDKLNGYTRIDPAGYATADGRRLGQDTPRFLVGGGNHITLAVVGDRVGYGCWIDHGGPNKGRVDVTPITGRPRTEPAYSFRLPTGGIHGAIACAGKVFFAPADGVCWVEADLSATRRPGEVKVHHIPLGKDGDTPRRTGAFAAHGRHVLFVTGKGAGAALVVLDAAAKQPAPLRVPLDVKVGTRAVTPAVAVARDGKAYAFVFHDRTGKDVPADDVLQVVALDPDGDGDWKDAKVVRTLKVGKSAVSGHFGHHAMAFDADRRFAFFTNPGDGTIAALSLQSLEVVATFPVGGVPTALVARGGAETED